MKKVLILIAMASAVSVASAAAAAPVARHHQAKVTTAKLYDYASAPAQRTSLGGMPFIYGVAY